MMLDEKQKKIGVIAASAGNHALALAYHGGQLGKIIYWHNSEIHQIKNYFKITR